MSIQRDYKAKNQVNNQEESKHSEQHPPYFDPSLPKDTVILDEDMSKNATNVNDVEI
ncbi:hypothetical protein LC085_13550 [Bacillus tianshenii]|uniref:hypothetical protein n=1 Tax=Sutcliffiella tianshenii TaxID=1463404 RepID=UPI001CD3ADCD|nr:hypothetical protein [Bacillus tianshenii]MCA1320943.1 hypothetical protein [Bacillus tianshenii]